MRWVMTDESHNHARFAFFMVYLRSLKILAFMDIQKSVCDSPQHSCVNAQRTRISIFTWTLKFDISLVTYFLIGQLPSHAINGFPAEPPILPVFFSYSEMPAVLKWFSNCIFFLGDLMTWECARMGGLCSSIWLSLYKMWLQIPFECCVSFSRDL